MFVPARLTLARQRRGLTKTSLAKAAGVTLRAISRFENGEAPPADKTVAALADALGFPPSFFTRGDVDAVDPETVSFRSLKKMTANQRDAAIAASTIAMEFAAWIDERFRLPRPNLPDLRHFKPAEAAEALRVAWGLGERPIKNMVHLLEFHGVRVFSLAEACVEVDAFSFWKGQIPYTFLNTMKTAEHSRFDAAHELGHLVLHRHGAPAGREAEREANAFASAFLMPYGSIVAAAPRIPTLDALIRAKAGHKVSVAALAYRLRDLGLMTEWGYRSICIALGRLGRGNEPNGIPRETSQVLAKVLEALKDEGVTKRHIASALHIPVSELDALTFGLLTLSEVAGGRIGPAPAKGAGMRPTFRLIEGG